MPQRKLLDNVRFQAFVLLAPAIAVNTLFAVWPMIEVVILSLQQWDGLAEERPWVGLENYVHIFTKDPVIIAPIEVATMWRWMYDPFFGLFSQLLNDVALRTWALDGLGDRDIALYSMFVAYVWQHLVSQTRESHSVPWRLSTA